MERKVVEKISTLHGMCPFVRTALLTANSLAHSSSVFFSNGFLSLLFNFRFYVHTDVYVFWKTKSCLIFDIHLSLSLDPLAVAIFVTHTHTQKKVIMNEMNIREGPPVVMLTTFIGHNLFSFFTLKKETGKAAPPFFFPLSTFSCEDFLFKSMIINWAKVFSPFFGFGLFSRNLLLEENAQRLYSS